MYEAFKKRSTCSSYVYVYVCLFSISRVREAPSPSNNKKLPSGYYSFYSRHDATVPSE